MQPCLSRIRYFDACVGIMEYLRREGKNGVKIKGLKNFHVGKCMSIELREKGVGFGSVAP
jgi:hypothetical protein